IEGDFREENPCGGGGGYLPCGIGWYRKSFRLPDDWAGRLVSIELDGVYKNSDVWINGEHLGFQPYGYTSFSYDLTAHLRPATAANLLAVRVDNRLLPDSRWYTGSGVYRHTWLTGTDSLHVPQWGVFVATASVDPEEVEVLARTTLRNDSSVDRDCEVHSAIADSSGRIVGSAHSPQLVPVGTDQEVRHRIRLAQPRRWSLEDPHRYSLRTTIRQEGRVVDEVVTPFGVREILFDADRGFLLNGQKRKILGVCLHHDGGCVGAAVPEGMWERRLRILKAMGCNAVRTSHYPPAPELLDLCDRMGFLVMDEAFDEWRIGKFAHGYHEYFDEWAERDLRAMIRRDRNHPSIVLWSVGNEIPEQTQPEGEAILKRLVDVARAEDPTRLVTSACDNIAAHVPTRREFTDLLDVVGYNYVDRWEDRRERYYSVDREDFPRRRMIGSENLSLSGVRGSTGAEDPTLVWGLSPVRPVAVEQLWRFTRIHDYVAGDFLWTGIDYLGETRWPHKNASCGVLDLCGFPKDGYYFYQSQWTEQPMLHLFPHWTWPGREGEIVAVLCFTNCESVELFLNGRSLGEKSYAFPLRGMDRSRTWDDQVRDPVRRPTTGDLHLAWDVPYQAGTLRAVGRRQGKEVCVEELRTASDPQRLVAELEPSWIRADGRDVCHVTVRVCDGQGVLCPEADSLVRFSVEGAARLIGVDNGRPDSHERFQAKERHAFRGLCLAVVQSTGAAGTILIQVSSEGLEPSAVELRAGEAKA
ncbi:MAG TPA: glycoside hydrolase family 2 TIM barrel-domain containing protein, partial [Spirochaetia bacterium]|nr:glycoside hydrolase family 2 TIM barrel-domain containing protein [Spirochaetia bacterium]